MKQLNGYRMRLFLVGVVAAIMLSGGRVRADFTFGTPTNLGPIVNSSSTDRMPSVSADSLTLYFMSDRPGGYGNHDLWVTTRATKSNPWGEPMNMGPKFNTTSRDAHPSISLDGLTLFFASDRPGGYGERDLWVTTRSATSEPWSEPVNLGPVVNSSARDGWTFISADGRSLFFSEEIDSPFRSGGLGGGDMWVATRANVSEPWGPPVNLGPVVNSSSYDGAPRISPDGSTLYFCSARAGALGGSYGDIWQAPIIPVVDLNGDGIVDSVDMCILIDHWGTNEPLCDIGPSPLGDGIVDIQDLIVLAEHLFEEVPPVE